MLQGALSQSTSVKEIKDDLYNLFPKIELKKTSVLPHGFLPESTNVIKYEKLLKEIGAGKDPASLTDDSRSKQHSLRKVQATCKDNTMSNADKDSEEEEEAETASDKAVKKGMTKTEANTARGSRKPDFVKTPKEERNRTGPET